MKKIIQHFRRMPQAAQALFLLLSAVLLALIIEIGVFQFSFFTQNSENYPETELDLSSLDGWNGDVLMEKFEDPLWDELYKPCLACGTCTFV